MADGGSSTETEDAGHYCASAPRKRKKPGCKKDSSKVKQKTTGEDARWPSFLVKFEGKIASCRRSGSGCCFCRHQCLVRAEPLLDEIKSWRENLLSVAPEVADRELLWIFQSSQTAAAERQAKQVKQNRTAQVLDYEEEGSTTETENDEETQDKKSVAASTNTSSPSAESDGESSDVLDMSEPAASSSKPMPLSRNHYAQRFGAKQPTVKLNTFVKGADKSTVICQQAAVLHGLPDHRKRQFRVAKQDTAAFDLCTRFLQLRYHNEGERLPDKFVFQGALKDRSLMIGSTADRLQKLVAGDSDELSDDSQLSKDELDEIDDRALSAMAIQSLVMSALVCTGQLPSTKFYYILASPESSTAVAVIPQKCGDVDASCTGTKGNAQLDYSAQWPAQPKINQLGGSQASTGEGYHWVPNDDEDENQELQDDDVCVIADERQENLRGKGSWMDAIEKYEEAASLVHYCYSTDPGWRKNQRGIDDDVLVLVDDVGSTEEEAKWQRKHRALCALNLAACKQKLDKFDEAIAACDTALELDPDNVKALYRRAESRIRPVKATAYEHDLAIKDLAKANRLDPSNQTVERLLVRLRGERRVQREKDAKTFTGMFDRGQIYDKVAHEARVAAATAKGGSLLSSGATYQDLEKRIEEISEEDPLEKRIQDAELLRDLYVRNGKEDEARKLNEQIKEAKKAVKAVEQPKIDWANPPAELVEDAKRHGLDLMDPVVVQELKRLELEGFDKLEEVAEGATDPEEEE
ncbi:Peptidyl-prolyl cis-trans isomerase D (PPIase D) (40 kDa peptidyl-prolyl cis-trans isomerase) (Cyclophilin-40) (CYP-40) (Cyclophilin-related protein) (Rotamase D), partial [Durusdinium trenchii]